MTARVAKYAATVITETTLTRRSSGRDLLHMVLATTIFCNLSELGLAYVTLKKKNSMMPFKLQIKLT